MDEVTHTILEQPNNMGFGGLGSGFVGGIIGGLLFGNNGAFGGNRAGVGYDTGAINGMANQLNTISGQISNADRDLLMQTSNQNQFIGNLVNSTGDAIVGAINSNARDTQAGIFQNTLTQTQNAGAANLAMCQGFGGVNTTVNQGIGLLNNNITEQGYQSRLQAQQLASQQQACCCEVKTAIEREGCANRELQREIQYQNKVDELNQSRAREAVLANQAFTSQLVGNAVTTIINALKPAATAAAG
jgi:hypothetical protein